MMGRCGGDWLFPHPGVNDQCNRPAGPADPRKYLVQNAQMGCCLVKIGRIRGIDNKNYILYVVCSDEWSVLYIVYAF